MPVITRSMTRKQQISRDTMDVHAVRYPIQKPKQANLSWLPIYPELEPPSHAVSAAPGIYVIRSRHQQDVVPGKWPYVIVKLGHIPYGGAEVVVRSFEVLCNTNLYPQVESFRWMPASGGMVPPGALQAGYAASTQEPLYIARAPIHGEMCVGKVAPSLQCAYVPWGGKEHRVKYYEVLCVTD